MRVEMMEHKSVHSNLTPQGCWPKAGIGANVPTTRLLWHVRRIGRKATTRSKIGYDKRTHRTGVRAFLVRPGKPGGRYVYELLVNLPDASA